MNVNQIKDSVIFWGLSEQELSKALAGLHAFTRRYKKGARILLAGSATKRMGLVLEGSVTIERSDLWGTRSILSHVAKNEFFAETYALLPDEPLLVDVVANEDCHILFLTIEGLSRGMAHSDAWTAKIVRNLLTISTHKNLLLSARSFHTAPKTIRGRVMSYLSSISIQKGASEFDIPFDRQQMADYLNVERTALSKELSKMKQDGLIDFRKSRFCLIADGR